MLQIALKMLFGDRGKYLGIVIGIALASVLMIQQPGILISILKTVNGVISDVSGVDIWVMDPMVKNVDDGKPLMDTQLYRVRGVKGVAWAVPFYKGSFKVRMSNGETVQSVAIGLDDATLIGGPGQLMEGSLADLRQPDSIIVDKAGAEALAAPGPTFSAEVAAPHSPSIDRFSEVELNGVRQKLLIQTNNLANPILLWLHGGPGTSEMLINHHCMNKLFDHFTVVHWDQRGTALSYHEDLKALDITFEKILDDAVLLTELLRKTYHQEKIFLIGHSFGSILGMNLIDRFPQYYLAFVGVGQVIDEPRSRKIVRAWLVEKLKADRDTAGLRDLPPANRISRAMVRKYRGVFFKDKTMWDVVQASPYFSETYGRRYERSTQFVQDAMGFDTTRFGKPIFTRIRKVHVPVYFFEGRHDRIPACAPEVVVEYFPCLQAPEKEIVWFEESGHHPNIEEPEKFQRMLIEKVWKKHWKGAR